MNQRNLKLVEQAFGWMKTNGLVGQAKLPCIEKISGWVTPMEHPDNRLRLHKTPAAAAT